MPIFVDRPTPIRLLTNGINGMEISNPSATQNKANPISASFKPNFILICGRYNTQVPVIIFSEAKTQAGAKYNRFDKMSRSESIQAEL